MKRYRLVDELYLNWIFSCINRGQIYNMVGGSVTHTHKLPSWINKRKDKRCSRPGARLKLELELTVLD